MPASVRPDTVIALFAPTISFANNPDAFVVSSDTESPDTTPTNDEAEKLRSEVALAEPSYARPLVVVPVTVSVFVAIANVRESADPVATVAASQFASPDCVAVMVQFPFDTMCTTCPLTVHTDVGFDVRDTVRVDVALVVTAKSLSPYVFALMLFSESVCAALSIVMVTAADDRAKWLVPTAFVAVTAHDPAPSTVRVDPVMVHGSPLATA